MGGVRKLPVPLLEVLRHQLDLNLNSAVDKMYTEALDALRQTRSVYVAAYDDRMSLPPALLPNTP